MKYAYIIIALLVPFMLTSCIKLNNEARSNSAQDVVSQVNSSPTKLNMKDHMGQPNMTSLAHIYVINLKERRDRCECMRDQLEQLDNPFPVYRLNAVTKETIDNHCPDMSSYPTNRSWTSIFCSNRLVFQQALQNPEKPKYIIIMEDDLSFQPNFVPELVSLLTSECIHENPWHVMAVDTFTTFGNGPTEAAKREEFHLSKRILRECKRKQEGADFARTKEKAVRQIYNVHPSSFGAHFQIMKSKDLEQLTRRKPHPVDHWRFFRNETTVFWQPGLVKQVGKWQHGVTPEFCDKSIRKNDHHVTGPDWRRQFNVAESESESESESHRMACPTADS